MPFYHVEYSDWGMRVNPISSTFEGCDDVMELPDELYARWSAARAALVEVECEIHEIRDLHKRSVEVH